MKVNDRLTISKIVTMTAYCVLVCAAVTFSFKSIFFSLTGAGSEAEDIHSGIMSRETLSNSGLGNDEVMRIQLALNELGYDTGDINGIFGVKTQDALMKFQREQGLTADGIVEPQTLRALGIDRKK